MSDLTVARVPKRHVSSSESMSPYKQPQASSDLGANERTALRHQLVDSFWETYDERLFASWNEQNKAYIEGVTSQVETAVEAGQDVAQRAQALETQRGAATEQWELWAASSDRRDHDNKRLSSRLKLSQRDAQQATQRADNADLQSEASKAELQRYMVWYAEEVSLKERLGLKLEEAEQETKQAVRQFNDMRKKD